ncbi:MAG TPA: FYDLN acid domain-containing protein [Geothrix sp.]|nr:FYDLN acid domain-containing protein [Geothrix sp.]
MANLGKKFTCFQCAAKFYDFGKPEAICPKCGANQKAAPAKARTVKKEKSVHVIEDDFAAEPEAEVIEEGFTEAAVPIEHARGEGHDPGDLRMDDYDE